VKRILSEAREFNETDTEFTANPLEDNIFEWHFTLRGPSSSEFQEGIYHGRILLPAEYPFRPPDVMLMTPNGRWELNKKVREALSLFMRLEISSQPIHIYQDLLDFHWLS